MAVKLYANVDVMEVGDVDFADGYTLYDARYVRQAGDTMTGPLLIHGGGNALQLKVKGHSTQSANLQEWQSSGGAVLAKVAGDGALTIGNSSDAQTYIGPAPNGNGYHYDLRYASSAADGLFNMYLSKTVGVDSGVYYASQVVFETSVDSGKVMSQQYGQLYNVKKAGAGQVNYLRGSVYRVELAGSSIANEVYGLQAFLYAADTSTLQYGFGIHVDGSKAAGATFNRMYGIYINDVSHAAIDNYALYTKAGDVRLMASNTDKIGFHGAAPVAQQTVTGSRGGNAALASLLTKLAALGLIVDSST